MTEFRRKIIDYAVLFDGITIGVSIFSGPRVNAGFVRAATAASSNYKRERSPWREAESVLERGSGPRRPHPRARPLSRG